MKTKTTFKDPLLTLLKYTAKSVKEIKAYKPCANQAKEVKKVSVSRKFRFVSGNQKSPLFVYAENFGKQGYAYVLKTYDSIFYYIDKDFDPVLNETAISNEKELAEVILTAPKSVLKYLSPATIQRIHEDSCFDLMTRQNVNPDTSANLDVIEKFMAKNNLAQPVGEGSVSA